MVSLSLKIDFPFEAGEDFDANVRWAFWNLPTTIAWFKDHGYTLYVDIAGGVTRPALPLEPAIECSASYPYAGYDTESYESHPSPLRTRDPSGKVVFAQDTSNRHVAIKLVRDNTDEYRVLRFLSKQNLDTLKENCLIPVLDFLSIEGYWFVVMPRWGECDGIDFPSFRRLCDVIDHVHSALKALVFLHEHNIAHGDIKPGHILINHFTDVEYRRYNTTLKRLRDSRALSYALFDFDFSTMLLPDMNKDKCRLPYERSWGHHNLTDDTAAGDFDYSPFVLDVGCMGVTFCRDFQALTVVFPALAPLLDMMTTWDLKSRFTAQQSLHFFEKHVSELSEDQLNTNIRIYPIARKNYDEYDRWQHLSSDLVERWKMYRTPPQPWARKLLCSICSKRWLCHIVPWTRWFFFQLFSELPRQPYRWLFPSKVQL